MQPKTQPPKLHVLTHKIMLVQIQTGSAFIPRFIDKCGDHSDLMLCVCVCVMQPLLPPPILLLLGVVLFGSGEAARFRNYQKHGGGEVCSSSFRCPLCLHLPVTVSVLPLT